MENSHIVTIEGLVKRYPVGKSYFTALNGISLTFDTGEFTGIVGPSGSGKTTLLNIIGSLDSPSEGSAEVLGKSIGFLSHKQAAQLRKKIWVLFFRHTIYYQYIRFSKMSNSRFFFSK